MEKNNNIKIRIANINGKYKLFYALVDSDNYVEKLYDEVLPIIANDHHVLMELLDDIQEARKSSVIMVNASNKKELMGGY